MMKCTHCGGTGVALQKSKRKEVSVDERGFTTSYTFSLKKPLPKCPNCKGSGAVKRAGEG